MNNSETELFGYERLQHLTLSSGGVVYLLVLGYVATIKVGVPMFMIRRSAYDLKLVVIVYNIVQVISCIVLIIKFITYGFKLDYFYKCYKPDYSSSEKGLGLATTLYYLTILKLSEFIETIIFGLRKKYNQISVLHVYHHVSTFLLSWYFMLYVSGGMLIFSPVLNCFIHIIMYSYYTLSSFGPAVQKKLKLVKKSITTMQIVQFFLMLMNCFFALRADCKDPNVTTFLKFYIPNLVILVILFTEFYFRSYRSKQTSPAPAPPLVPVKNEKSE